MENKNSYTFDSAISEVSKAHGPGNWTFYEAAELYKEKATEELRTMLETSIAELYESKKEIERLKESNKELVEALKELYSDTVYTNRDGDQQFMWGRIGGANLSSAALKAKGELKKAGLDPYNL